MTRERMNDLALVNHVFIKDFQLDPTYYPDPGSDQELRDRVISVISELLDSDFEKLLLILYRIDVK